MVTGDGGEIIPNDNPQIHMLRRSFFLIKSSIIIKQTTNST
jgi:hypothetical protein